LEKRKRLFDKGKRVSCRGTTGTRTSRSRLAPEKQSRIGQPFRREICLRKVPETSGKRGGGNWRGRLFNAA